MSIPISPTYNATVIGAGPAGLAVVGMLLDYNLDSILWIDPSFNAGRLSHYAEVPSNTKVKFFMKYVLACSTFKNVINALRETNTKHSIFDFLENMDQEQGASLYFAIEMVKSLTELVLEYCKDRLVKKVSTVVSIEGNIDSPWTLYTQDGDEFNSDLVFLATGSAPKELEDTHDAILNRVTGMFADDFRPISLDLSVAPSRLKEIVRPEDTVAIIGSSHSAILALKNLVELPANSRPNKIYNLYRSELKYAVYMDGWILNDNTGLKGEVADWAKANLSEDSKPGEGLKRAKLQDIIRNEAQYRDELKCITANILSVGFKRNALPQFVIGKEAINDKDISYDGKTANLVIKKEIKIPNIFGYGIAFPERVKDPYGNEECAVGLWKFMNYISKTLPNIIEEYVNSKIQYSC